MSQTTNHLIYLQETYQMEKCPECLGDGQVEYEVARPHAGGFNEGYIDTVLDDCELCGGQGEVIKPCPACGEGMSKWDALHGAICSDCRNEEG
jgi:DnaJ-class molecular chaperone